MPKFRVTIPVTFTVLADSSRSAEDAAFEAVEEIPLTDGIVETNYSIGPGGPWAEEVKDVNA